MRRHWLAVVCSLACGAFAPAAFGQATQGERSRSSSLLEVNHGQKIYKHNISDLNRVDTDTYAGSSIFFPAWTSGARFYIQGNAIKRIGNSSDSMTTFVTFTPPANMRASRLTKCGPRLCLILTSFDTGTCDRFQIFSYDMNGGLMMGALQRSQDTCIRDAIDDIWNPNGGFVMLTQTSGGHPLPWRVLIQRRGMLGEYLGGRDVPGFFQRIAQAIAPNRVDGATCYILDTDYKDAFVKRVVVQTGEVVGSKFWSRAGFAPHDLAYVDSGRNVALIAGGSTVNQYAVATFDDQNLSLRRDRTFNY